MSFFSICGLIGLVLVTKSQPTEINWSKDFIFTTNTLDNPFFDFSEPDGQEILVCYEDTSQTPTQGVCILGLIDKTLPDIQYSDIFTFETGNASDPYLMFVPPPQQSQNPPTYVLGYTNAADSSSGPGTAVTVSVLNNNTDFDQASIVYSPNRYEFNSRFNDQTQIGLLAPEDNEAAFVVCYSQGAADALGIFCRVGRLVPDANNPPSIRYADAERAYQRRPTTGMVYTMDIIDERQFVFCFDEVLSLSGVCVIGTVDENDDSISFTNLWQFSVHLGIDWINVQHIDFQNNNGQGALVCFQTNSGGICNFGFLAGSQNGQFGELSFSKDFQFATSAIDGLAVTMIDGVTFALCYQDLDSTKGVCQLGYISPGNVNTIDIQFSDQLGQFANGDTDGQQLRYIGDDQLILCYFDGDEYGSCVVGDLS